MQPKKNSSLHSKVVAAAQASHIAASILAAGHSLNPQDARATWQRYGIEDDPKQQRLVLAALDTMAGR